MGVIEDCGPVSVVIPTRNRSVLLKRAIQSCLDQGDACGEVIVVDDHSTDDTADVVGSYANPKIRYLASTTCGAPGARNCGLRASTLDLVKFLDDDDYLVPDALQGQLRDLSTIAPKDRLMTVVHGYVDIVRPGPTGNLVKKHPLRRKRGETDVEYTLRVNIPTSCPVHPRDLLLQIGGFEESLQRGQEADVHLRLALHGARFVYFPRLVYVLNADVDRNRISNAFSGLESLQLSVSLLQRTEGLIRGKFGGALSSRIRRTLVRRYMNSSRLAEELGESALAEEFSKRAKEVSNWTPFVHWILTSQIAQRAKGTVMRLRG